VVDGHPTGTVYSSEARVNVPRISVRVAFCVPFNIQTKGSPQLNRTPDRRRGTGSDESIAPSGHNCTLVARRSSNRRFDSGKTGTLHARSDQSRARQGDDGREECPIRTPLGKRPWERGAATGAVGITWRHSYWGKLVKERSAPI
jgi:hypothetical protein